MSLPLTIEDLFPPPARGRKSALSIGYMRDLGEADVRALWEVPEGSVVSSAPALQRIRTSHHLLAKVLAEGRTEHEAALITGYSSSRISVLKADPAFKQLVEYYSSQIHQIYLDVHSRIKDLGLDSIEEIQARLDENPASFTNNQLMELAKLTLDRSGHGPTSKTEGRMLVGLLTPEQMAKLKHEVASRESASVLPLGPQSSSGPVLSLSATEVSMAPSAPPRQSGEGANVSAEGRESTAEVLPT